MWKRIVKWQRELDQEQIGVLRDPCLATDAPAGYRRLVAKTLADFSVIERQELYRFLLNYHGRDLWLALARLSATCCVVGVLVKLALFPEKSWLQILVAANGIGLAMAMSIVAVWFNYSKTARFKYRVLLKVAVVGMFIGFVSALGTTLLRGDSWQAFFDILPKIMLGAPVAMIVLIAAPTIAVAVLRSRHYDILTVRLAQEAEQARLARELSETQLRLLRAQIEPHFLFNTLGAVQQLAEQGAPRAAELTAHLIDFLRASMSDMRCEQVSLATEFGLVESYLAVMQIRMGERLRFRIDLPSSLAATRIPSMLVLTLAENAIKHGIEPSLRGGDITVTAQEDAGQIRIAVHDSGVGMSDTPGNGTGLENVCSRLRLTYGESASLALSEAEPGLLAELLIPRKDAQ
jgi:signal transduction histidine kinase